MRERVRVPLQLDVHDQDLAERERRHPGDPGQVQRRVGSGQVGDDGQAEGAGRGAEDRDEQDDPVADG